MQTPYLISNYIIMSIFLPQGTLSRSHNCIGPELCGVCNQHENEFGINTQTGSNTNGNLASCGNDSNCFFTIGTTSKSGKKYKKKKKSNRE